MKAARCILKIVAGLAALSAAVYLIVSYWDKILDTFYTILDKIEEKKACCPLCACDEYDDFEDVEIQ